MSLQFEKLNVPSAYQVVSRELRRMILRGLAWWDACIDPQLRPVLADPKLPIWVGADASTKRDSTAVVAVTWDEAQKRVRLVTHKVFQPSPDEPLDFENTIEATIRDLRRRFQLRGVWYDPFQMQAVAQRLQRDEIRMVEFPQSVPNLTTASSNLYELIKGRNLIAYPDDSVRLAVSRAVAVETTRGWRLTKEKASHKIDVVVALAMAAHACVQRPQVDYNKIPCVVPFYSGRRRYIPGQSCGETMRVTINLPD